MHFNRGLWTVEDVDRVIKESHPEILLAIRVPDNNICNTWESNKARDIRDDSANYAEYIE